KGCRVSLSMTRSCDIAGSRRRRGFRLNKLDQEALEAAPPWANSPPLAVEPTSLRRHRAGCSAATALGQGEEPEASGDEPGDGVMLSIGSQDVKVLIRAAPAGQKIRIPHLKPSIAEAPRTASLQLSHLPKRGQLIAATVTSIPRGGSHSRTPRSAGCNTHV